MTEAAQRWGIIGGGILGMTLAYRLARSGKQVVLYEGANQLGGLAAAWRLGDVTWDRHYHVILPTDTQLLSLLSELGLANGVEWETTRTGFYTDGRLYSLSNSLEFLRFPPLRLWDKLRLAFTIGYAARIKNWRRLEGVTAVDWLRRWSGSRTVEKIWLPLLRAKLGDNAERVSAAFIWAIIARMYSARRTGLKRESMGYVRGGYARILEQFEEALKAEHVEVRPGKRAVQIVPEEGRVRILFDAGEEILDRVVLTVPGPEVARLCPDLASEEARSWRDVEYQGIVCASVLLRRPLAGYYLTNITDSWVPFTAVIETSALVDRRSFGGHCLVYLPKYVAPGDPLFDLPDREVEARFVAALEKMYPAFNPADVLCFRVSRVRRVLALSTLHYSQRLPPPRTSLPGVFVVNSAQIVNGTLNVNETIQLAERAMRELLITPDPLSIPRTARCNELQQAPG